MYTVLYDCDNLSLSLNVFMMSTCIVHTESLDATVSLKLNFPYKHTNRMQGFIWAKSFLWGRGGGGGDEEISEIFGCTNICCT